MWKKALKHGFGLVPVLLLVLSGCPEQPDASTNEGVNTERIEITNIPSKMGKGTHPNEKPYKIYVQLSKGMDASAGYVAKGEAKIDGNTTLTIETLKDPNGDVWSGKGNYNIAITLCPQYAPSSDYIQVHASMPVLSHQVESFQWDTMLDLSQFSPKNIPPLYDGIVKVDPDITTN